MAKQRLASTRSKHATGRLLATAAGPALTHLVLSGSGDRWEEEGDSVPAFGLAAVGSFEVGPDPVAAEAAGHERELGAAVDVRAGGAGRDRGEGIADGGQAAASWSCMRERAADRLAAKRPRPEPAVVLSVRPEGDVEVGAGGQAGPRGGEDDE